MFFESYAKALEEHDAKTMAYLHLIPCTMLSDTDNRPFNEASKLEGFFAQGIAYYRQLGIVHVKPDIWNKVALTDKLYRVKVYWSYFDKQNKPVYNCEYHYLLRKEKNNLWRIALSISVNERERMEEWRDRNLKHEL
jgi:hypothetical protein